MDGCNGARLKPLDELFQLPCPAAMVRGQGVLWKQKDFPGHTHANFLSSYIPISSPLQSPNDCACHHKWFTATKSDTLVSPLNSPLLSPLTVHCSVHWTVPWSVHWAVHFFGAWSWRWCGRWHNQNGCWCKAGASNKANKSNKATVRKMLPYC